MTHGWGGRVSYTYSVLKDNQVGEDNFYSAVGPDAAQQLQLHPVAPACAAAAVTPRATTRMRTTATASSTCRTASSSRRSSSCRSARARSAAQQQRRPTGSSAAGRSSTAINVQSGFPLNVAADRQHRHCFGGVAAAEHRVGRRPGDPGQLRGPARLGRSSDARPGSTRRRSRPRRRSPSATRRARSPTCERRASSTSTACSSRTSASAVEAGAAEDRDAEPVQPRPNVRALQRPQHVQGNANFGHDRRAGRVHADHAGDVPLLVLGRSRLRTGTSRTGHGDHRLSWPSSSLRSSNRWIRTAECPARNLFQRLLQNRKLSLESRTVLHTFFLTASSSFAILGRITRRSGRSAVHGASHHVRRGGSMYEIPGFAHCWSVRWRSSPRTRVRAGVPGRPARIGQGLRRRRCPASKSR